MCVEVSVLHQCGFFETQCRVVPNLQKWPHLVTYNSSLDETQVQTEKHDNFDPLPLFVTSGYKV